MKQLFQLAGLLLFVSLPVRAQITFNAQAGTGTMYEATGAQTTMYAPFGTSVVSVGDYQGHLLFAATEHVRHFGDDFYFGDKAIYLTSGSSGIAAPLVGVYVEHKSKDRRLKWSVFTGAIGPSFWLPYGYGTQPRNFGAGYSIERVFGDVHLTSLAAIAGNQKTVLEGASYQTKHIHLIGTGGLLQNSPIVNGSATYLVRDFGLGVNEQTLILNGTRADVTSEFASDTFRMFDFHVDNVNGRAGDIITAGQNAGVGLRLMDGVFVAQTNYYTSHNQPALILTTATETVKRKYMLNESVSESAGRTSFNMGGGYTSNQFSANVGESVLYYPLMQNHPWVQTTSLTISVRIKDASTTVSTLTTPSAKMKYTVYGGDYLYTQGAESGHTHSISKFEVFGNIATGAGMGIADACLQIDGKTVYTNGNGDFSVHINKQKTVTVIILPDQNLLGKWTVKSAPKIATAGVPVQVIEERE